MKGWTTATWTIKEGRGVISRQRRKDDFEPYTEPFRPLYSEEILSVMRMGQKVPSITEDYKVSYQALPGGFTICNIIVNGRLFSGSSHCIKSDRWLPIRGKMNAFHRALQSEGVELPQEKYFTSDGLVYSSE